MASGDLRSLEAVATNCLEDPAIAGIVVNAHDVTEQTNLSRALRTLTEGNQVVVRATDEASLLADVCATFRRGRIPAGLGGVRRAGHGTHGAPARVGGADRVSEAHTRQLG